LLLLLFEAVVLSALSVSFSLLLVLSSSLLQDDMMVFFSCDFFFCIEREEFTVLCRAIFCEDLFIRDSYVTYTGICIMTLTAAA